MQTLDAFQFVLLPVPHPGGSEGNIQTVNASEEEEEEGCGATTNYLGHDNLLRV